MPEYKYGQQPQSQQGHWEPQQELDDLSLSPDHKPAIEPSKSIVEPGQEPETAPVPQKDTEQISKETIGFRNFGEQLRYDRNFGEQLEYDRKNQGWTVEQLAKMLGVPTYRIRHWEKNISYPGFLSRQKLSQIFGNRFLQDFEKDTRYAKVYDQMTQDTRVLRLQINTPQLTAQNFTTIFSSITELHTKCWLIQQGRCADVVEYTQTHDARFVEEANLQIVQLTYNSPLYAALEQSVSATSQPSSEAPLKANVNVELSPQSVMEAVGTGIDAITQAKLRYEAKKLENEAKKAAIKHREQEIQAFLADKDQERQLTEVEKQKRLLEIELKQVELERSKLAYEKERLELDAQKMETILKTANTMVTMLAPDTAASDQMKTILVQALIPTLTQLGSGQGLQLALPVAHSH